MNKKKNKIKSVVAIVLLLLLCVCFLCGCDDDIEVRYEKINYTVLSDGNYELKNFSGFYNDMYLFKNEYELRLFGFYLNWWDYEAITDKENGDALLNEKLRTYDDEFFNANNLVMLIYIENATENVSLTKLTLENESLIADVEVSIDSVTENDGKESYRVFLIEIPPIDIKVLGTATRLTIVCNGNEVIS